MPPESHRASATVLYLREEPPAYGLAPASVAGAPFEAAEPAAALPLLPSQAPSQWPAELPAERPHKGLVLPLQGLLFDDDWVPRPVARSAAARRKAPGGAATSRSWVAV
jgi:hypothetical protein